jgi:hypothetical protein
MPRPEYRDPKKKTIYAEVDTEVKAMLKDICYHLDKSERDAIAHLVQFFYTHHRIKPRPSRNK